MNVFVILIQCRDTSDRFWPEVVNQLFLSKEEAVKEARKCALQEFNSFDEYNSDGYYTIKDGKAPYEIVLYAGEEPLTGYQVTEIQVPDNVKDEIFRHAERETLLDDAVHAFCEFFDLAERYDGTVSTEEFEEFMYSEFPKLDTDGLHQMIDNAVSLFEKRRDRNVAEIDTWHDVVRDIIIDGYRTAK